MSAGPLADPASSLVVAALEQIWAAIRRNHPQVPAAVLVVAPGGDGRRLKWGHFAAGRWQVADTACPEVLVSGEGLARTPREVLGTLLHEAAHGLAHVRRIADTSRGGRYHNRRYRELAGELGLEVAHVDPIGWSATTVPEATAARYVQVVQVLASRLVLWRHREQPYPAQAGSRNLLPCTCACPRRIRVAPATLAVAPILCGACGVAFTPDQPI
jgi:hypothetical protein